MNKSKKVKFIIIKIIVIQKLNFKFELCKLTNIYYKIKESKNNIKYINKLRIKMKI